MSDQLSLRTRLLLAVGAVALLALAFADVIVYTSLKSYLYSQVDLTLQASHLSVEQAAVSPGGGQNGGSVPPPGGQAPGAVELLRDRTRECAGDVHRGPGCCAVQVVSGESCPGVRAGQEDLLTEAARRDNGVQRDRS